jgi:beta-lactamase class A
LHALAAAAVSFVLVAPAPELLQARYDAARDREERALARGDRAGAAAAHADVAWAERWDQRPRAWRGARDVPSFAVPGVARAERTRDARLSERLAEVGRAYRGWAALWTHDLTTGVTAGWNADASFPAASTVKLGVLAEALRRGHGPASPLWYDLRQLTGWSSNLASNRVVRRLGGERAVGAALRRLGARASTYPGPYRAGTAVSPRDAPKPPPHSHWRVTTAHDLGRMLYAFHAAAAGNRYVQRTTGLSRAHARRAVALLVHSSPGGLIEPYTERPVAHKEGWISDLRASAAVVYGPQPRILVVLAYRPGITDREARELGRRAALLTLG